MACPGENELLEFVEGTAAPATVDSVHLHLDGCESCQEIVAALARSASTSEDEAPLLRGDTLDRFVVLEELGRGGMGVVYAAFDPELERKVALKVIRPAGEGGAEDRRRRLLSEAQALARLSHPNVVTVHEARALGARVFVAMELIAGTTLRQVLRARPLGWRRVIELHLGAGEGLAAAHEAQLVHRDFKPDNVLVGPDGRARVTDFGLAWLGQLAPAQTVLFDHASPEAHTRSGAVLGTPAYMAPEQWRGEPADARCDQFSFCVSLHEALYGARPFPSEDRADFFAAVERGLPDPPAGSRVPGHVRRVLARGLALSPEARFPSMRALLDALRRNPWTRFQAPLLATGAAALVAVGLWFGHLASAGPPVCSGAQAHLAGTWDDAVKSRVRAALDTDAFRGVERALDGYTHAWAAMHQDACEATRVRGEQSEAMLDLRITCLERRARDVKALVTLFERRGKGASASAVQAAYGLPPLQECADLGQLAATVKPPTDPAARAQVAQVDAQLSEVRALTSAGKLTVALSQAEDTVSLARKTAHAPTLAEALFQLALLEEKRGDAPAAQKTLLEAAWSAQAGHLDRTAARARIELVQVIGVLAGHNEAVPTALSEAEAAVARVGQDADLEATLEIAEASALDAADRCEEALPHVKRALSLADRAWDEEDPRRALALHTLGTSQRCLGDLAAALKSHHAALALRERTFGKEHPEVAESLNSIANVLFTEQDFAAALPYHQRALAIRERAFGPSGAVLAGSVLNVGVDLISLGRNAEGREYALRSLALYEAALGTDSPRLAMPLLVLGHVEVDLGMPKEADRRLERALTLLPGRDDEQTAMARFNLARALRKERKDPTRARSLALSARRYFERRKDVRQPQLETIDTWLKQGEG